ncbi:hypothetical protein BjapCC829_21720 [Bradyrhizobium barranii]|uniref:Uncharacterized protein n=1 Tax=Bradyrhizobium barranii TaxID=2992140 RepID=A0ABY3QYR5_9BRAD|nr:hypothetical protein [Bradyrhizobium japonicum]UFW91012.1 hypothetical protein BjapCC829_21720 [Bradyrhizobium japonicum]
MSVHTKQVVRVNAAVELLAEHPVLKGMLARVVNKYNMRPVDVLPKTRQPHVIDALHEFYYQALTETLASSTLLGELTARDHATVLYGSARWAVLHGLKVPRGATGWKYIGKLLTREQRGQANGT